MPETSSAELLSTLTRQAGLTFERIGKPTFAEKTGWSDDVCREIAMKKDMPDLVRNATTQKAICIRYLNFYASGIIPEGYSAFDLIAAMISITPGLDAKSAIDTIWDVKHYSGEGGLFRINPKGTVGEASTSTGTPPTAITIVSAYSPLTQLEDANQTATNRIPGDPATANPTTRNLIHTYNSETSKSFLNSMSNTLNATSATDAQGEGIIKVRRLLGFTALTFMRGLVKDSRQMALAFAKEQYRKNIGALLRMVDITYSPPCNDAIVKACDAIMNTEESPQILFAKIVIAWVDLNETSSTTAASLLTATVLTHTSYTSMNLINLLVDLMHLTGAAWVSLCKKTLFSQTKVSWERIGTYMETYHPKVNPKHTQPWARVINNGYFHNLNGAENFGLCAIFAGALESENDNTGIWDAYWVRSRRFESAEWQVIGQALRESYTSKIEDMEGILPEGQEIIARARRIKNTTTIGQERQRAPQIDASNL